MPEKLRPAKQSRPQATRRGGLDTIRKSPHRLMTGILACCAISLLVAGAIDPSLHKTMRSKVTDAMAPVLQLTAKPAQATNRVLARLEALQSMADENARLAAENERLRGWHTEALRLTHENDSLRKLVAARPEAARRYVSAPVIGEAKGGYLRSVIISAGTSHGLREGHAVRNGAGIIGKVTEASDATARVLLLSDMNFRLPVMIEGSRHHAMLVGDNTDKPVLRWLDPETMPQIGDRIVTSGTGGLVPSGLPVGLVASVKDGLVRIAPSADLDGLDMVSVIDYGVGLATADLR